jgi:hypothetical protein
LFLGGDCCFMEWFMKCWLWSPFCFRVNIILG